MDNLSSKIYYFEVKVDQKSLELAKFRPIFSIFAYFFKKLWKKPLDIFLRNWMALKSEGYSTVQILRSFWKLKIFS